MANKKIIDLVHEKSQSMQTNPAEAGQNSTLAIAAIKGGIGSPEWRAYVMQFVVQSIPGTPVDPRQLNRLMGTDETKDLAEMDRKRAYILGNAVCNDFTTEQLPFGVETIDEGIAPDCSPTVATKAAQPTAKGKATGYPKAKTNAKAKKPAAQKK